MNERQKRFVKLLLETNEYLPVKYYADILNISEKSIRRDIESINYYMKKYN
ncbi:HTH domain-containing protein, partial [Anaerorhabdus sp.]